MRATPLIKIKFAFSMLSVIAFLTGLTYAVCWFITILGTPVHFRWWFVLIALVLWFFVMVVPEYVRFAKEDYYDKH